jgi:hypothetical protein
MMFRLPFALLLSLIAPDLAQAQEPRSLPPAPGPVRIPGQDKIQPQILRVDPVNGPLKSIDFASMRAASGDTIVIANGEYRECAIFRASNITIRAETPGKVVIRDQSCAGKGIFVITGNDVTVDGLTLRGAKVPDGNGAGIRFEGNGLVVRNVTFINNQNGILSNSNAASRIMIDNSLFDGNGTCENAAGCAHGIYINMAAELKVTNSRFFNTRNGHHIKSRALKTVIQNTVIDDGINGTASYAIQLAQGGDGLITGNTITKGPMAENKSTAIFIGGEGNNEFTAPILVTGNRFINRTGTKPYFVFNTSANAVRLTNNIITGPAVPVSGKALRK